MTEKETLVSEAIENFEGLYLNGMYILPISLEVDTTGEVCLFYMQNGSKLVCRIKDCDFEEVD